MKHLNLEKKKSRYLCESVISPTPNRYLVVVGELVYRTLRAMLLGGNSWQVLSNQTQTQIARFIVH